MSEPLPSAIPITDQSSNGTVATLLYVEDILSNLHLLKLIVDCLRPGWRLLVAQDGHDGLRQIRAQRPDLILLNLQLPGMGGEAVLANLRADPVTSRIPVLVLSAEAGRRSHERLLTLGANDYLPKPFNVHVLVERVDLLLRDHCFHRSP